MTRSDGFVVQLGDADPTGEVHGYVPPGAKKERKVPLELSFKVSVQFTSTVYVHVYTVYTLYKIYTRICYTYRAILTCYTGLHQRMMVGGTRPPPCPSSHTGP